MCSPAEAEQWKQRRPSSGNSGHAWVSRQSLQFRLILKANPILGGRPGDWTASGYEEVRFLT